MGADHVKEAFERTAGSDSEALQHHITESVWGGIWTGVHLDLRSRSMITLAMLIAQRAHAELEGHVRGALRNGLTRHEISEIILHAAGYCGAPTALSAMRIAQTVFDREQHPHRPPFTNSGPL